MHIVSSDCAKFGIFNGLNTSMMRATCNELRVMKSSNNLAVMMSRWDDILNRCGERQLKDVLKHFDFSDAFFFAKSTTQNLTPSGMELKTEAQGQIERGRHITFFCKWIPPQSFDNGLHGS